MHISGFGPLSVMANREFMGHAVTSCDNPFGDQFIGVDPMDMRHGVFAWNGMASGGGSYDIPINASSLTTALFPGYRAPDSGTRLAQVARQSDISKILEDGTILGWTQNLEGEKIPNVFALCELPVYTEQLFDTLLDVNGLEAWMPRVMLFRSDDADARDPMTLKRRFRSHRSLHIENIHSRYKTSVPQFYGRFCVDYRQLNGGGLQMEWNIKGDQTPPEDPKQLGLETPKEVRELKPMKTNNSSFTLIPSPNRPDRTVCAYNLNAQPQHMPFVASVITLFVPNENASELDRLFQSLLNRTVERRWTAKSARDPLGLDLTRVSKPTPHRFTLRKVY